MKLMPDIPWTLSPARCFGPDPAQRKVVRELYETVKDLRIVSPHGHVPPALPADRMRGWAGAAGSALHATAPLQSLR